MNIVAQSTLWLSLMAILISSFFYFMLCYRKDNLKFKKIARIGSWSFATLTTIASAMLMYFFLTHDFRFEYVINYSSSDLPLHFLVSSFWAGQEGSFLLWVFLGAWLGVILLYKARNSEPHIMTLYNLQLIFLSILLIKQSPFRTVPVPFNEGMGLNMLLQDFWMVIHPPIVFLGYAAYSIPFAYAMASLWRREYKDWIKQSLPWTSFAFLSLGAGIIIGGVWSYKVLGWGGYWGWDPVENASLLPWLAGTALIHSMILYMSTGRLAKTNYFLTAFSFILIIYSTFLTRSGILADFSVHSFVDLGITGWLVFFIFAFILIAAYLLITRAKEIPLPKSKSNKVISFFSREFGLIGAVILLCLSAVLTGLGTSAPLITRALEKASKVSNQFYVNVNLPLAILMGLLLSYIPILKFGKNDPVKLIPKLIIGLVVALLSAIIAIIMGFPGMLEFLLVIFAGFTIGVNLELLVRFIRKSFVSTAAAITHLGVGMMLLGFIVTTVYDRSERAVLPKGESTNVFDYEIKFIEANFTREAMGNRLYLPVELKKDQQVTYGNPDIFVQNSAKGEGKRFHHPFIKRGLWTDLYLSPEGYQGTENQSSSPRSLVLKKGESTELQDYKITFVKFDIAGMGQHQGAVQVGVDLLVSYKGMEAVELQPIYTVAGEKGSASRVKLPGNVDAYLDLSGINATNKTVELFYDGPLAPKAEVLYAEISMKPGMSLLWLGVTLLLLGAIVSIYRRKSTKTE